MSMDFRERINDHQEGLRAVLDGRQASMWTSMPAIITKVSLGQGGELTCEARPATKAVQVDQQGKRSDVELPLLVDLPVVFPHGGDYVLTFPVTPGDECLVVFASRCIDNWWMSGDVQPQYEQRMHSLADGIALVGPYSQKTKVDNVSTTTTQLRSNDGKYYVEVDTKNNRISVVTPKTSVVLDDNANTVTAKAGQTTATLDGNGGVATIDAPNQIVLDTPLVTITGVLSATRTKGTGKTATISGDVQIDNGSVAVTGGGVTSSADQVAGSISQQNHIHPDPQGGFVGKPE